MLEVRARLRATTLSQWMKISSLSFTNYRAHFVTRSRYSLDNFQTINNWRKKTRKKNGEICEYLETRAESRTYMHAPTGIKRSSRTDHGNLTRIVFATHCTVCIDNLKRLQKWSAV